jgi:hypothetical protein
MQKPFSQFFEVYFRRPARTEVIQQSVAALALKSHPPLANNAWGNTQLLGYFQARDTLGGL